MAGLKYTGGGFGGSLQGIPARDLTAEEVEEHGGVEVLLKTGLYARAKPKASSDKARKPSEDKEN